MSLLLLFTGIATPDADTPIPPEPVVPGVTVRWGGGSGPGLAGRKRLPFPIIVIEPNPDDEEDDDDLMFMMMS